MVSSWWADEARKYGVQFEQHEDRYARTEEWLSVLNGVWQTDHFSHEGRYYHVEDNVLQPKPVSREQGTGNRGQKETAFQTLHRNRPLLYAGGESEAAKNLIARTCDGYVMHGDPPAKIGERIADMNRRREGFGLGPMLYGVAAYSIVRDTEAEAQAERERITDVQSSASGYANYQQWLSGTKLEQQVSLEDYSVSNRGLRSGLGPVRPRRCRTRWASSRP